MLICKWNNKITIILIFFLHVTCIKFLLYTHLNIYVYVHTFIAKMVDENIIICICVITGNRFPYMPGLNYYVHIFVLIFCPFCWPQEIQVDKMPYVAIKLYLFSLSIISKIDIFCLKIKQCNSPYVYSIIYWKIIKNNNKKTKFIFHFLLVNFNYNV